MISILEAGLPEAEAVQRMHLYADKIKRRGVSKRYGVFYEFTGKFHNKQKLYRICLVDRNPDKRPPIRKA